VNFYNEYFCHWIWHSAISLDVGQVPHTLEGLMQPLCQISKMLYSECTLCDYVRSAPSHKNPYSHFPNKESVTKVRNSIKINHLPSMIFIWWHSKVSMLDNKCLFCSIQLIFMSKYLLFCWCVLFSNPKTQCALSKPRQKVKKVQ
jgi:hypothetical protein